MAGDTGEPTSVGQFDASAAVPPTPEAHEALSDTESAYERVVKGEGEIEDAKTQLRVDLTATIEDAGKVMDILEQTLQGRASQRPTVGAGVLPPEGEKVSGYEGTDTNFSGILVDASGRQSKASLTVHQSAEPGAQSETIGKESYRLLRFTDPDDRLTDRHVFISPSNKVVAWEHISSDGMQSMVSYSENGSLETFKPFMHQPTVGDPIKATRSGLDFLKTATLKPESQTPPPSGPTPPPAPAV